MKHKSLYNDHYQIEDVVASGGFATIYRARDPRYGLVALKVSRVDAEPGFAEALKKEAELLRKLNHDGIVKLRPIHRPGKADIYYNRVPELDGHPWFFAMEYLAGGTLAQYLESINNPLSVPEAADIALEVTYALAYINSQGYTHNDLKLENIVFRAPIQAGQHFSPVLVDFGIAARVKPPGGGSPYIMPPEQLGRERMIAPETLPEVDKSKVDIWAIGVMLYRMLGGRLPFDGRTERSITQRIIHSQPTQLFRLVEGVPRQVNELVVDQCLAKEPTDRPTIEELIYHLTPLTGDGIAHQAPAAKKSSWWPWS